MKVLLQTGDKAPKLFADSVISEPDLDQGGIYVFVIDRKFIKVGSSHKLRTGIKSELPLLSKKVLTAKSTVEVFVLENDDFDKEKRLKKRRHWLSSFRSKAPAGMLLNGEVKNTGGKGPRFDPKANRLTVSLSCMLTLQSPKLKQFKVNADDLQKLEGKKGKTFESYSEALDYLHQREWFTVGMSFFETKTMPKTEWKKFLKHSETKKAFK